MLDRDKSIVAQAVMKSLLMSPMMPSQIEGVVAQQAWVVEMFLSAVKIIEDYAKIPAPINQNATSTANNYPTPKTYESHLSDERVAAGISKERDEVLSSRNLPLKDKVVSIATITEKEYKPKKFRYGIKGSDQNWYSTFFKNHFQVAAEARDKNRPVKILYEVGEYNGKPQYTIQSIEIV